MEVFEAIKSRRSIRRYKSEDVSEEKVNAVLDAARWAPSFPSATMNLFMLKVVFAEGVPDWMQWLLFDSQTSGGLMLAVPPEKTQKTLQRLHEKGAARAAVVGTVVKEPEGKILVISKNPGETWVTD